MSESMPDVSERVCRHCGKKTGITYGTIPIGSGLSAVLCHTSDPNRPDCYRRVTVYHESLGILRIADPVPDGVENIGASGLGRPE